MIKLLFFLIFPFILFAQQNSGIDSLKKEFDNLDYKGTIHIADSLLADPAALTTGGLMEIYKMKGIAHFSLSEDGKAELSFIKILQIDTSYSLDPVKVSPKIISFYDDVKNKYLAIIESREKEKPVVAPDTVYITREVTGMPDGNTLRGTMLRSIIFPGWGHLYKGENVKGYILTGLGAVSFISSLYFIFDSSSKENEYINERDASLISSKYDDYNFSYKMKIASIITYAAVWVFSQADILLLNNLDASVSSGGGLQVSYRLNF